MRNLFLILGAVAALVATSPSARAAYFADGMLINSGSTTVTAGGTTTLTKTSPAMQQFTGATTQTVVLPNASTMKREAMFVISNDSSGTVTVNYHGGSGATTLKTDEFAFLVLKSNSSSTGTWDIQKVAPPNVTASRALVSDSNGYVAASSVTATELGHSSGVTSSLCGINQSCTLTNKTLAVGSNSITGTASRLAEFDASGILQASAVTTTEAARLASATSSNTASTLVLRDGSGSFAGGTFTGSVTGNVTGNASTATALAADPAACTNQFVRDFAANGTLVCASVSLSADVTGALARTSIAAGSASHVVINDGSGLLSSEATLAKSRGGWAQDNSSLTFPSSGTVPAYTPNQYGVVVSGSGAAASVIAPDASTTKVLRSGGTSANPNWDFPPTANYFHGYMDATWTSATTVTDTYVDFTIDAGSNTLTTRKSNGITVTAAGSNFPGITWTPPTTTATYAFEFRVASAYNSFGTGMVCIRAFDGTNAHGYPGCGASGFWENYLARGIVTPGTTSPYTLRAQAGTDHDGDNTFLTDANGGALNPGHIEFILKQIAW